MTWHAMERAAISWNRGRLDLGSDEILAQILDRGELDAWAELYRLAAADLDLRKRIRAVIARVPLAFPAFWLAALGSQGETIDWDEPLPVDKGI